MQKNNNILNSIIAGKVVINASVQITDPTAANYIAAGEVVAARLDGTVINTVALANAAASSEYIIVQGQGAGLPLIKSPVIKKTNVTKAVSRIYTPAVEQEAYFGYNGAAGNIDVTPLAAIGSTNEYVLRVNFREDTKTFGDKMNMIIGDYIASYGATVSDVAFGLAKNINRSAKGWADVPIKAEVITNGGTILTAGAGVSTRVTNGSKTVIYTATDPAILAAGVVAGSLVTLAGATYQVASRVNTNVGGVGGVNTATITLTMPFQGTSATLTAGTTYATQAGYYSVAPTAAGIKITGLVRRFRAGVWKYYKVRFVLTAKNAGTTIITAATDADKGIGTGKEVQEIEWETVGNEGAYLRTPAPGSPVPYLRLNSSENSVYSIINLQFFDQNGTGVVAAPVPSYKQLIIAAENASIDLAVPANNTYGTSVKDTPGAGATALLQVLNAFLGTSYTLLEA